MTTQENSPFFVVSGDPGGANALVPVIRKLIALKQGHVLIFTYRQATEIMRKNNILCTVLDEVVSENEIREILTKFAPCIVITSTSFNSIDLEKKFICVAKLLEIPSLAVLDFWSNYAQRFSDRRGYLSCVPDKIAIMDETSRQDMIAEGFDPGVLVITGQPAFDTLAKSKQNFSSETRQRIRNHLKVPPDSLFIVFVSQPFSKIYGRDCSNPQHPGFDEKVVLKYLISSLEKISEEFRKEVVLLIRPHPRERMEDYSDIPRTTINVIITSEGDPREIVMSSDIVTGMNTELLIEACYLGCIVISIQPGLQSKDILPTNKSGCSIPVYSGEKLTATLRRILIKPETVSTIRQLITSLKQDGQASERVVNIINLIVKRQR